MDFPIHFPFPQFSKQTVKTDKVISIFFKRRINSRKAGIQSKMYQEMEGMDVPSSKKRNVYIYIYIYIYILGKICHPTEFFPDF